MNPADMTGGELERRCREVQEFWGVATGLYPPAILAIMWEIVLPELRALAQEMSMRGNPMTVYRPFSWRPTPS